MALRKKQDSVRAYEVVRRTTCGNCPTGCGLKVFVRDGKVVDLFGDEEHPVNKGSLCPKGMLTPFHLKNPERLTRPRIREDLSEPFRTVSWDEAIAFMAGRLAGLLEAHGRESLVIHGKETDPFDYLAAGTRFGTLLGTPHAPGGFFPAPFGRNGAIRRMFGVAASRLQGNVPRDWCNSRCIVVHGCDPAASDPITFGPVLDARDRGATLIVIDSKRTVTSSKATRAVRVKPGTGSIFLRGLLNLLIERGRVDDEFIADFTEGFEGLKASVSGYTPERVSEACWTEPEELRAVADLMAHARPVQVIAGSWASRGALTDADLLACADLAVVTGSIGIPGGGVNFLGVSPFSFEPSSDSHAGEEEEGGSRMPSRSGTRTLEGLLADPAGKISSLVLRGDPCSKLAGGAAPLIGLARVPLVAHLTFYENETAGHAHVLLPESFWLESTGLFAMNNGRALQRHNRVIDPPGECHSPLEFWTDLARAMNLAGFPFDGAGEGAIPGPPADFYDQCLAENPLTRAVTFADLDPEEQAAGGVLWPCTEPEHLEIEATRYVKGTARGINILFQRNLAYPGSSGRFPTPKEKILFQVFPDENGAGEESGCDAKDAESPLMLLTGVLVDHVEQFGSFVSDRRPAPLASLLVHPKLAKALGVANGETLAVEGASGGFTAPVSLSDDVDPRVIWFPSGAGADGSGPERLFPLPGGDVRPGPAARVTVRKAGTDGVRARKAILRMIASLEVARAGKKAGSAFPT